MCGLGAMMTDGGPVGAELRRRSGMGEQAPAPATSPFMQAASEALKPGAFGGQPGFGGLMPTASHAEPSSPADVFRSQLPTVDRRMGRSSGFSPPTSGRGSGSVFG